MRWLLRILCVLLVVAVTQTIGVSRAESYQTWDRSRVNHVRYVHHLWSLTYDRALQSRAQWWANYLAEHLALKHDPNGPSVCWREGGSTYGQNVGYSTSYQSTEYAFEKSSVHRDNILSRSFRRIGIGIAHRGERYYLVQDFCG